MFLVEGGVACLGVLAADVVEECGVQFEKVLPVLCECQHGDFIFLSVDLPHFCAW